MNCPHCTRELDRVDHYGIEHLILDDDVYRPVNVADGDGNGVASEIDIRCGHCHESLPRDVRAFFYKRWYAVLEATL